MGGKVRIGLTRDILDKGERFIMPGPGLKLLDNMLGVEYKVFSKFIPEVNPEQIRGFDIVITVMPKWMQRTIVTNDQLLAVHRTGVGYDMVDVPALTDAGIVLTITPEAVRLPKAVSIITFLLALSMRLLTDDKLNHEAQWAEKANYHGVGLVGGTLGSIGVGNIGHEMFRLTKPFG